VKALVNALQARRQTAGNLTQWLVMRITPTSARTPQTPGPDRKRPSHIDPLQTRPADQESPQVTDLVHNMIKIAAGADKKVNRRSTPQLERELAPPAAITLLFQVEVVKRPVSEKFLPGFATSDPNRVDPVHCWV
jgi:hypothetical protein